MKNMNQLLSKKSVVTAVAIDQRQSIKKMIKEYSQNNTYREEQIVSFKRLISKYLTPYSSAILLDPIYGKEAFEVKDSDAGLILSYEISGYSKENNKRLPTLIEDLSVKRLVQMGADAVKVLLYYDVFQGDAINDQKRAFIERVGSECRAEEIPFFLEIVAFDSQEQEIEKKELEKPLRVIQAMEEFSLDQYSVDVLKVEVPVNIKYVEGYTKGKVLFSKEEAMNWFKKQSESTNLPFIFLSAGVDMELFQKIILLAAEAGSTFNGVLCGRATWQEGLEIFIEEGKEAAIHWFTTTGKKYVQSLNQLVNECATPIVVKE